MTTPEREDVVQLRAELDALRARTVELERAQTQAMQRQRTLRATGLVAVSAAVLLGSGAAVAANGSCPNNMPWCFVADEPAQASQVNHNFAQLKEWLEGKVGAVSAGVTMNGATVNGALAVTGTNALVRVQQGTTSNAAAASGKMLFVSGNMGEGQSANGGFEVRHDNLSQGVGIGFNTIYATGSTADQPLYLKGRGAYGVAVLGNFDVTANTWSTHTNSGWAGHGTTTAAGGQTILCADGQYMCGVQIGHVANDNNYWTGTQLAIHCCSI